MDNNWRPGGTGLDGLGLVWTTERGSDCICSACVDSGPFVALDSIVRSQTYLSRAYICLWEREDLLLSCHGL
jgi:hypothetical protein